MLLLIIIKNVTFNTEKITFIYLIQITITQKIVTDFLQM